MGAFDPKNGQGGGQGQDGLDGDPSKVVGNIQEIVKPQQDQEKGPG